MSFISKSSLFLVLLLFSTGRLLAGDPVYSSSILGKWISEQKNVIVQVYKEKETFRAKVLWFNDTDDPSRPMNTRTDWKNPEQKLRSRRVIGMDVLWDLTYNKENRNWDNGIIYDARSGKEWSSYAYLKEDGELCLKGYWKLKFISKSMTFRRME